MSTYRSKQAQIRQIIYKTVSEATFMQIKLQAMAVLMLSKLISIYENKGEIVQMDTLTQLRTMRCLNDDDVVKHIIEMQRLKEALDHMGAPLNNAHCATYIKASLPEKFCPLLSTIATTFRLARCPITSAALIQEIFEMADENTIHTKSDAAAETAMAASSGKGKATQEDTDVEPKTARPPSERTTSAQGT
ncbi:hypothetical protein K438DRAFT_1747282 [Mycena galopus ATCC 62051]|nr:hypothetical protein K438DRAFT_1747282 [Mycena galopus ATCC 62051]